jgi:hypothetical protein
VGGRGVGQAGFVSDPAQGHPGRSMLGNHLIDSIEEALGGGGHEH